MLRPGILGRRHGVVATPVGMADGDGNDDGDLQEWGRINRVFGIT